MKRDKLFKLVEEWCHAQAQYDKEGFPGGLPRHATGRRLYLAGRGLYLATDVTAKEGRYFFNPWFERELKR